MKTHKFELECDIRDHILNCFDKLNGTNYCDLAVSTKRINSFAVHKDKIHCYNLSNKRLKNCQNQVPIDEFKATEIVVPVCLSMDETKKRRWIHAMNRFFKFLKKEKLGKILSDLEKKTDKHLRGDLKLTPGSSRTNRLEKNSLKYYQDKINDYFTFILWMFNICKKCPWHIPNCFNGLSVKQNEDGKIVGIDICMSPSDVNAREMFRDDKGVDHVYDCDTICLRNKFTDGEWRWNMWFKSSKRDKSSEIDLNFYKFDFANREYKMNNLEK